MAMNNALNLQRLAALREGMQPAAPTEPPVPVEPVAPVPVSAAVTPPDPGAAPIDASLVPVSPATTPAADAVASSSLPEDDEALTPIAEQLLSSIAAADSPEAAQTLVRQFIREHTSSARNAALAELPQIAENLAAAADEYAKAAEAMFGEHPDLREYGDLLGLLTQEEYGKDPKRAPQALYASVAERAKGMLKLQKGGPSLPDSAEGGTPTVTTPTNETRNDMRLRALRAPSKGGK